MHNKYKPWFDDQFRHACGLKQEAHLRWTRDRSRVNWKEFVPVNYCSPLTIGGTVLNESDDLIILGVIFDSKMTFE